MKQSVTRELYAYWSGLKGARLAPDRSDIDPAAIRHLVADAFIIEIDPQCSFPIRLCGARLNAFWLAEQTGRSFLDLWEERDQRNVAAALLTVIDAVTPVVGGAMSSAAGVPPLDLELLLLPLRYFGKTHSRLLGSLAPAYQPNWFGHVPATALKLNSLRVIDADERMSANRPAACASASRSATGRPKFVVYEGGRLK